MKTLRPSRPARPVMKPRPTVKSSNCCVRGIGPKPTFGGGVRRPKSVRR